MEITIIYPISMKYNIYIKLRLACTMKNPFLLFLMTPYAEMLLISGMMITFSNDILFYFIFYFEKRFQIVFSVFC